MVKMMLKNMLLKTLITQHIMNPLNLSFTPIHHNLIVVAAL